jgi:arginase
MSSKKCILIGAPVDSGKRRQGCLMGPDAFRTAGLAEMIEDLGHQVEDVGNLMPEPNAKHVEVSVEHEPAIG